MNGSVEVIAKVVVVLGLADGLETERLKEKGEGLETVRQKISSRVA